MPWLNSVARRALAVLPVAGLAIAICAGLAGCAADSIENRRQGQQLVCHDGKTLTVSNADSFVHLDHGDTLGPCPEK